MTERIRANLKVVRVYTHPVSSRKGWNGRVLEYTTTFADENDNRYSWTTRRSRGWGAEANTSRAPYEPGDVVRLSATVKRVSQEGVTILTRPVKVAA